jgi:hypothetical protein
MADHHIIPKESLGSRRFTLVDERGPVWGISEKYVLEDDTHERWLFKPTAVHKAYVEEAGFRLGALAGINVPEAYLVRFGAVTGSLIRLVPNAGNIEARAPETLTPEQVRQLVEMQIFHWTIASFDTHGRNFLLTHDGALMVIDLDYAFLDRYMFRYDLAGGRPNKVSSYFTRFWTAVKRGQVTVEPGPAFAFIRRLCEIPDAAWDAILRPLARYRRAASGRVVSTLRGEPVYRTEDEFVFAVLMRRRALERDFARFLSGVLGESCGTACSVARGVEPECVPGDVDPRIARADPSPIPLFLHDAQRALAPAARLKRQLAHRVFGSWEAGLPGFLHLMGRMFAWLRARTLGLADRARGGFTVGETARLTFDDVREGFRLQHRLERTGPDVLRLLWERAHFVAAHDPDPGRAEGARRMIALLAELPGAEELPPRLEPVVTEM